MTEVNPGDELVKQPACTGLGHAGRVMGNLMPVNVVCQVTTNSKLTDNSQVVCCEENLPELDDVRVVKAQALVQDLTSHRVNTAMAAQLELGLQKPHISCAHSFMHYNMHNDQCCQDMPHAGSNISPGENSCTYRYRAHFKLLQGKVYKVKFT